MGLLDGLLEKAVREYLEDQWEDFRGWHAYALEGIDPAELGLTELAEKAWWALQQTIQHGSPPD